ncbi:TPR end-of-group domain-containing protein [Leptothermofonsia sp. ETS-13]|uniref:TPR end-of-group domain-containing protein n=1 Tax=Leptothermofonsia sp. ETS-13 TaxID=3035696 RepID=UPI003B9E063C
MQLHPDHADTWYNQACCYVLQTRNDQAVQLLQTAFCLKPELREYARKDSFLDALRQDSRFRELAEG